ncbi:hypothetical protein SAMN05216388_1009121 [Halorientalis persicus]|uniref:Uncharacterized protein n=1 Tax=Halorientalis persicus TaxID=1367881 RepID=A0A1H8MTJ2_9EURY|nr:hypothetical protein [Halorientalis persicus]SEO20725.1 hypothetical protein SAMN05216388_1009121 [Halorientalis persicus]
MTNQSVSLPAGWSPASGGDLDGAKVYVYDVTDSKRILVGLHSQSKEDTGPIQLRASTIEEKASVNRHDFVVAEYDDPSTAIDEVEAFMDLLSESLSADQTEDERLFVSVQELITEFTAAECGWRSIFSRGGL